MDPDQDQREKQSVNMCVVVGDVPNSGYTLRFTQEHAYLRISTKPVDMPEDSPQTPQTGGVDSSAIRYDTTLFLFSDDNVCNALPCYCHCANFK